MQMRCVGREARIRSRRRRDLFRHRPTVWPGNRLDLVPSRQERIDAGRIELNSLLVFEVAAGLVKRHRLLVGMLGRQRVEHVGDRNHPRFDRNVGSL